MKKELIFKVGDCIAASLDTNGDLSKQLVYNPDYDLEYGKVIAVLPNNKLLIKWDTNYHNQVKYENGSETYEPIVMTSTGIFLADEAKKKFSVLEKEYKAIEDQIKDKLKGAADLLKSANKLAISANIENLANMYDAIQPLYDAMDKCGWNTSSFNC